MNEKNLCAISLSDKKIIWIELSDDFLRFWNDPLKIPLTMTIDSFKVFRDAFCFIEDKVLYYQFSADDNNVCTLERFKLGKIKNCETYIEVELEKQENSHESKPGILYTINAYDCTGIFQFKYWCISLNKEEYIRFVKALRDFPIDRSDLNDTNSGRVNE